MHKLTPIACKQIFIITQYSPLNIKKEWKDLMDLFIYFDLIDADDYALFTDRMLIDQKLPQKFGTKFLTDKKTKDTHLDNYTHFNDMERNRDSLFLMPLLEYINILEKIDHIKVRIQG